MKAKRSYKCLMCKEPITRDSPHWPFCSERCKMVDLGRWLGGEYKIAGEDASENQTKTEVDSDSGEGPKKP